ncbi:hypothetical protein PR202_ga29805 [Eleusine coracana subsp. coracana]|uniref:ATPase AAA-type core domain-containing protein n=1 Tax=Eleusine coracana subsp. coracana TaxID=191504 RepID=A0AAV5DLT3_ELECO|nr:hypothetical protein QOZ80_7AG0569460 [Eleusine coracana subsp. coracana]GJN11604.1 hypothetical protein PR202_ga29805 [Eleusine coracana subsp. coracana]
MNRLCLTLTQYRVIDEPDGSGSSCSTVLCLEPGGATTDVFEGVEFTWTSVETDNEATKKASGGNGPRESLELSFDAEHTDVALNRYMPFVMWTSEDMIQRKRDLRIFMNEGRLWHGITHRHPATFDTLAMDSKLKQSIIADLDRFLKRREYYRRIGKAWKLAWLPDLRPARHGQVQPCRVAAMANYLRFNIYDLDLSDVHLNSALQRLLIAMPNKCILLIEDIDCCFDAAASREKNGKLADVLDSDSDSDYASDSSDDGPRAALPGITLSGLLNFIDGLWSTCGEERIIIFTTNYKERLDPALLRPGRMDMHIYMCYCCWEAFKMLAKNYFLIDDHPLFGEIQELLSEVEVMPAEVSH